MMCCMLGFIDSADDIAGAAEAVAAGKAQKPQPRNPSAATRRKRTADAQSLAELDVNQLQQGAPCTSPAVAEVPKVCHLKLVHTWMDIDKMHSRYLSMSM